MTDTVLDRIVMALQTSLAFDPNVMTAPVALLWPDEQSEFSAAIPRLQERVRIIRFGPIDADARQGPAYWLRCAIKGAVELDGAPDGIPVVYLPGVSRDRMRALDHLSDELAPLGALQHQCQWFAHPNGKDWSVRSLLSNKERGLGLDVSNDAGTGEALVASLGPLLDQPVDRLQAKHIDASFLNTLLNPDPVRLLLNWLNEPQPTRGAMSDEAWNAFVHQCKQDFGFDPARDGEIEGARRLGEGAGAWAQVWQRFREAPAEYPDLPNLLDRSRPDELLPTNPGSWPADNLSAEVSLRTHLLSLAGSTASSARSEIRRLEEEHRRRRSYVWADLLWAPLAMALEHLAVLAERSETGPPGTDVDDIAQWYAESGWRADGAVLAALDEVDLKDDLDAVATAITAVYQPWLDVVAQALQAAVGPMANAGTYQATAPPAAEAGTVVVFVDGLRLDVAHRLADRLEGSGLEVARDHGLAALPTVTQTAKPALVPIDQGSFGPGSALDARRAPDGPTAGIQVLRALMGAVDIQVLAEADTGDPSGTAWTEAGTLDHRGHDLGVKLAHEIDDEVARIAGRIADLLDAGWQDVQVVTDHGWILLPAGLPKNENLPVAVTEVKKGRCARLKDGADTPIPTVPWHWDPDVRIAVAPGVSCFEANQTYEHGGVSPQECVVPRLTVRAGTMPTAGATIASLKWRGLALAVEFEELPDGAQLDLRTTPGDAGSSIAESTRDTGGSGRATLFVLDDDLEGATAHLVVVAADGSLLVQRETTVGHNR